MSSDLLCNQPVMWKDECIGIDDTGHNNEIIYALGCTGAPSGGSSSSGDISSYAGYGGDGVGDGGVGDAAVALLLPNAVLIVLSLDLCSPGKVVTLDSSSYSSVVLKTPLLGSYSWITTAELGNLGRWC